MASGVFEDNDNIPSRPRVFLIDFEVAIEFPPECPVEEQVVTGVPVGGSFGIDRYTRPHAPEYISGKPYSPFKLDIWQMASSLTDVRVSQFFFYRQRCSSSFAFAEYYSRHR